MPTLRARSGAPQRWRIVNAAKSRFFLLDLEASSSPSSAATAGCRSARRRRDILLITPGERVDVIVTPDRRTRLGTAV